MDDRAPLATLSFDDGGWQDAEVMALLRRYAIPATYYLPSCVLLESVYDGLSLDDIRKMYQQPGVEIGSHTRGHKRLRGLRSLELLEEIDGGKYELADFFGIPGESLRCFAYPYGDTSEEARRMVESAGFVVGRTCQRSDPSRVCRGEKGSAVPITCILRPQLGDWNATPNVALATRMDVNLVSHSWELIRFDALKLLDEAIDKMRMCGYEFVTNGEFACR